MIKTLFIMSLALSSVSAAFGATIQLEPGEEQVIGNDSVLCKSGDPNVETRTFKDKITNKSWFFVGTMSGSVAEEACQELGYSFPTTAQFAAVRARLVSSPAGIAALKQTHYKIAWVNPGQARAALSLSSGEVHRIMDTTPLMVFCYQ